MGGRSSMRRPGLRTRFKRNSQRAKFGSMSMFCPPICTKNAACPMKVTPRPPLLTSVGLYVLPARGVTAECRTRRPNCCARLRKAGFRRVALIIEPVQPANLPLIPKSVTNNLFDVLQTRTNSLFACVREFLDLENSRLILRQVQRRLLDHRYDRHI
jgi:hypothetical protein